MNEGRGSVLLVCVMLLLGACEAPAPSQPRVAHMPAEGALGPYSASVHAGDFCFVSGKIGAPGLSFAEEARSAIHGVEQELSRVNLSLADVVSVTVYLTDLGRYAEFNAIYAERFTSPYPARAVVEVSKLPGAARVEIQVVALRR